MYEVQKNLDNCLVGIGFSFLQNRIFVTSDLIITRFHRMSILEKLNFYLLNSFIEEATTDASKPGTEPEGLSNDLGESLQTPGKEVENTAEKKSLVDVSYFRNLLKTETDRLTCLCDKWTQFNQDTPLSEDCDFTSPSHLPW